MRVPVGATLASRAFRLPPPVSGLSRAVCVVAGCALILAAPAFAQPERPPQVVDDAWDFEEVEIAEPTLVERARQQGADVGLFVAFAALAMVGFFRKSDRLKLVTLVAAV